MDSFPYDIYCPSAQGVTVNPDARVNVAQFGDGYRQAAPDGINTDISTIEVAWNNIGEAAKNEIYAFLFGHLKAAPFLFKLPDWPQAKTVYCERMSNPYYSTTLGLWSITATLRRAAHLGVTP